MLNFSLRVSLSGDEWLENVPGISLETSPCIRFPNQAQVPIMYYLKSLADAIVRMRGKIYTDSHSRHINEKSAECNGGKITANHSVVATNTPVNDFVAVHSNQVPFHTYVIAAKI